MTNKMNDKERYEYAEELVALANEANGPIDHETLGELISRRGEVKDPDDMVAILNIATDLLKQQEQEDNEDETTSTTSEAEEIQVHPESDFATASTPN
jgi:hypothetical protein